MHTTTTTLPAFLAFFLVVFFLFPASEVKAQGFTVGPSTDPLPVSQGQLWRIGNLSLFMYNRWAAYDAECDPKAVFAIAYLYMTANAKRLVENGYFDDGDKMVDFITSM